MVEQLQMSSTNERGLRTNMELKWSTPIHYGGDGSYNWPSYDGVYVIAKEEDGILKAVYVGQGKIKDRMEIHEGKNEPNTCLKNFMKNKNKQTKVYHAKVDSEKQRDDAEHTIWYNYGGSIDLLCNDIAPPGEFDFSVNFPFDKIVLNYK